MPSTTCQGERCAECGATLMDGTCESCQEREERARTCRCGADTYRSRPGSPVLRCGVCGTYPADCTCGECRECGEGPFVLNGDARCEGCADRGRAEYRDPERGTWHGEPSARFPYYLGVEMECGVEDWTRDLNRTMAKWGTGLHEDGSVRVGNRCHEIVTAPARGDAFESQIDELCAGLAEGRAKVNKSCGLHVHVDVRALTIPQVLGIVRLYSRIEKTLYSLVARSRRSNHFAGPWGERLVEGKVLDVEAPLTERENALDVNVYGSESAARRAKEARHKHESRYHGLNLNAIPCHGTLEFRLHHGTVNARKIKMWAAVCSAIVRFGAEHPESEIAALRGTPAEILERVLSGDRALIGWTRARRRFFEDKERERRGLAPRRAARAPRVAAIPVEDPGALEDGESPTDAGRVGRRAV